MLASIGSGTPWNGLAETGGQASALGGCGSVEDVSDLLAQWLATLTLM